MPVVISHLRNGQIKSAMRYSFTYTKMVIIKKKVKKKTGKG